MVTLLLSASSHPATRGRRDLDQYFVDWCLQNCLQIDVGKTREVVDFSRGRHTGLSLVNIQRLR